MKVRNVAGNHAGINAAAARVQSEAGGAERTKPGGRRLRESIAAVKGALLGKQETPELSEHSRINEQELYAALIHEQLSTHDPSLAEGLTMRIGELTEQIKQTDSDNAVFRAVKRIVRGFKRQGLLDSGTAKELRASALGRAQLDSDRSRLSTRRWNEEPGDTPLRSLSTALAKVQENLPATELERAEFRAHRREERRAAREIESQS